MADPFYDAGAELARPTPAANQAPSDPFYSAVVDQVDQARAAHSVVLMKAVADNPDIAAERERLSRTQGVPIGVVERHYDRLKQREQAVMLGALLADARTPTLYRRMGDPVFAPAAVPDVPTLSKLERSIREGYAYLTDTGDQGAIADVGGLMRSIGLGATVGLGKTVFDLAGAVNDLIGWQSGGDAARQAAARARKAMDEAGFQAKSSTGQGLRSGAESLGQNLVMLPMALQRGLFATAEGAANLVAGAMGVSAGAGAYSQARDAGRSTTQSLAFGIPQGVFEYAFEKIPAQMLFGDLVKNTGLLKTVARQLGAENVTEQITTVAQNFNEWMNLHPDKTAAQFLSEMPEAAYQTFVATTFAAGMQTGALHGINRVVQKMTDKTLKFEQDLLTEQMRLVNSIALRERSPEQFRALVDGISSDVENTQRKAVFVDAEVLSQLPQELLNQLSQEVREQIEPALVANATVAIPMTDVLTLAPGTPLEEVLNQHGRLLSPSSPSKAEAQAYQQMLAADAERIAREAVDQDAWQREVDAIQQTLADQLNAVGRFTADQNAVQAQLAAQFFSVMANRTGVTPAAFFAAHPLRVAGPGQQSPKPRPNANARNRFGAAFYGMDAESAADLHALLSHKFSKRGSLSRDDIPMEFSDGVDTGAWMNLKDAIAQNPQEFLTYLAEKAAASPAPAPAPTSAPAPTAPPATPAASPAPAPAPNALMNQNSRHALTVEGFHYSTTARPLVSTHAFGSGLAGSSRDQYLNAADQRLRRRAYFYADKGTGITPEAGVGGIGHRAQLTNVYDADADPLRLKQGRDALGFESAVLDAGFSGYLSRQEGTQPAQVIMLGDQVVKTEVLGPLGKTSGQVVPPPATRESRGRDQVVDRLRANKALPSGSPTRERWGQILAAQMPQEHAALAAAGVFEGEGNLYKDELIREFIAKTPAELYQRAQGDTRHQARAQELLAGITPPKRSAVGIMRGDVKAPTFKNLFELSRWFTARNARGAEDMNDPAVHKRMLDALYADTLHALTDAGSAVGWYDAKVKAALDLMAQVHPEIATDEQARFGFIAILAITSNQTKVNENFELADALYSRWKETGALPTNVGEVRDTRAKTEMSKALSKLNQLVAQHGWKTVRDFMTSYQTARDITAFTGFPVAGENLDTKVYGAVFLGPKIGAFFNNLYGNFDTVTMDRWFMRTINRIRGSMLRMPDSLAGNLATLVQQIDAGVDTFGVDPAAIRAEVAAFNALPVEDRTAVESVLRALPRTREYVSARHKVFAKGREVGGKERGYVDRTPENQLAKNLDLALHLDQQTPRGGDDRNLMRSLVLKLQQKLQDNGIDMVVADIQAALWYYEKDLVARLRGKADAQGALFDGEQEAEDYETAAKRVVARYAAGPGRGAAGPADGPRPVAAGGRAVDTRVDTTGELFQSANPAPAFGSATLDDFKPGSVAGILDKDGWAILTAENPAGQQASDEANAAAQASLQADLDAAGFTYLRAIGRYGNVENPFIVTGITQDQADALGRKYGQDSVLTRVGLTYRDGTTTPAKGVVTEFTDETRPADFYTEVPSTGAMFAVDLDFEGTGATDAEAAFADRVENDFDALAAEYARIPGTNGGQILNTDEARELSPWYRLDRSRSADIHEPASAFVKKLYKARLAQPTPKGKIPVVVFTAGGTGAGKSTSLELMGETANSAEMIYDTNMNTFESADKKVRQALAAGRDVHITLTVRDPVEALVMGALPRAMRMGRTVPVSAHAATHQGAMATVERLAQKYAGDERVRIRVIDNSRGRGNAVEVSLADAPRFEYNDLERELRNAAATELAAGRISEAVFRGTTGESPDAAGVLRQVDAGDAGGAQPQTGELNQTDTPAFRKWFGDSKVVDADGKPLVVYHGTNQDFDAFNPDNVGDNFGVDSEGFFFTDSKIRASGYADPNSEFAAAGMGFDRNAEPRAGANVMPVYLSIQNPLTLEAYTDAFYTNPAVEIDEQGISLTDYFDDNRDSVMDFVKRGGHDGVVFQHKGKTLAVALKPEQIKSAIGNRGTFDPNDPSILNQKTRGSFTLESLTISIGPDSDLSTFQHELGHFFLEVMADVASQPNPPAQIARDMQTVLDWFGVKGGLAEWNGYTLDQKRKHHERLAESFEQYLFEGKAPTTELMPMFRRLRAFMISAYKTLSAFLQGRGLRLNDDVRKVFDRMLATDTSIAEHERAMGLLPDEEATAAAIEQLQKRSLRDLKWLSGAKSRALAKLQKEAKAVREFVSADVRNDVYQEPVYRAERFIRYGKIDEAGLTNAQRKARDQMAGGSVKLSLPALKEMYGESPAALWRYLDTGKNGLAATEGAHPNVLADMLGFESGDALVRALLAAEPVDTVIEAKTDQKMLEDHGDLATPEALEDAANEAVHNEARARALATELKGQAAATKAAMGGRSTSSNELIRAGKQFAEQLVARTRVGGLKSAAAQHRAAEARAGRAWQAATQKADTAAAVKAKRDQFLNHMTARAMQDAQAELKKIAEFFAKIGKGSDEKLVKGGRDPDVVNAMRAILAAYGVRESTGQTALEYLDKVKSYDPAMYAALQPGVQAAQLAAKPLGEMTVEELRALNEELRAMWTLAKRSRQMEVAGNLMDIEDAAADLVKRLEEKGIPAEVPGTRGAITAGEEAGIKLRFFKAFLSRVEQWTGRMDGAYGGPFLRYVFQPIKDAADRYRAQRVDYRKRFAALVESVADKIPAGEIHSHELGYTFGQGKSSGMAELLHAMLHTGNESNKRKLLLGGRPDNAWATERADGSVDSTKWDAFMARMHAEGVVTKAHWDFVQGVWDLLEETKPAAQETHRRVYGRYFKEVEASPVQTPFGDYRGGYVPAMTDSRLVQDAAVRKLAEEENESMAYAFPSTPTGFTKSRVESYTRPLMLDLRTVAQHIDKVLLFTHMQGAQTDVRRLLTNKSVAYAINRVDPGAYEGMLLPWLNRAARQVVETPTTDDRGMTRFFSALRARSGLALMMGNVSNSLQQITGFSTAAVLVGPTRLMSATASFLASPKTIKTEVAKASTFMRDRMLHEVAAMNDAVNDIMLDQSVYDKAKAWTQRHAYFLQSAIDNTMSPIVWTAAYNQAVEQGMTHDDAVRFSDGVIRQTQGSTLPEDISRFESGPAAARMFTQFMGYFNMMANTNATALTQTVEGMGLRKGAGRLLYIALAGLLVPIWVAEAIALAFRGGPDDEDKDGEYLDDWIMAVFGMGTAKGMLAQVPIVNLIGQGVLNRFNTNPADDKFSLSPAVSLAESAVDAPFSVYKAIAAEGSASKAVKDTAAAATLITGLPFYTVARPLSYGAGLATGQVQPRDDLDAARGLITGSVPKDTRVRQ